MSEASNKLPDKLSDMILLALADVHAIRADPRYQLYLSTYHEPKGSTCLVCFAGAVMARTLGTEPHRDLAPSDILDEESADKLHALNFARLGDIKGALAYWPDAPKLNVAESPKVEGRIGDDLDDEEEYSRFVTEMTAVASWLSERGA